MRRASALALVLATACSGGSDRAPSDERADVERLQLVLGDDPAVLVLEEIDQAIAADRPVMAADLIDHAAIPAVQRHLLLVQGVEVHTPNGTTLRSHAGRILRHRITALEHWRDALARGVGHEDEVLLDALHENAEAEHELAVLHQELATIRPLESGGAGVSPDDPQAAMPDLVPPSAPSDDEAEPTPEPDPHAADPVDGRETPEDLAEPVLPPVEDHHAIVPRTP